LSFKRLSSFSVGIGLALLNDFLQFFNGLFQLNILFFVFFKELSVDSIFSDLFFDQVSLSCLFLGFGLFSSQFHLFFNSHDSELFSRNNTVVEIQNSLSPVFLFLGIGETESSDGSNHGGFVVVE